MTSMSTSAPAPRRPEGWFTRTERWLDDHGKGAWIAAMVLGFIFFWPVGLALLFYMIWSKRMFNKSCSSRRMSTTMTAMRPTGNAAFDAYKSELLNRLDEEQKNFKTFLARLRDAKDKNAFDTFMDARERVAQERSSTEPA